jgi:endonuclease YncB( thermonuclease family)
MAQAIEEIKLPGNQTLTVGHFGLGARGTGVGSVKLQVHDGDTITARALGNFGLRFLGVDAPEISFMLPGNARQFIALSDQRWENFLTDPFAGPGGVAFAQALLPGLLDHLRANTGPGIAANHYRHADKAQKELERQVENDKTQLGMSDENLQFFLAFALEITDRFGRMLAYINRQQNFTPRPADYNTRLLNSGLISPYFIWPNIDPFRKAGSLLDAVPPPFSDIPASEDGRKLRDAQAAVRAARQMQVGLFDAQDPLRLQPFEVRFLAQRRAPNRWVINLSAADNMLIPPQEYYTVPNVEDRLFIPDDYVLLFVEKGWQKG